MKFVYDEYYLKIFIIPLFIVVAMVIVAVLSLVRLRKVFPELSNRHKTFLSRFINELIPILLIVFSVSLILVNVSSLKYGIYLLTEQENETATICGTVQQIEPVNNSPRYSINDDSAVRASIVTVNQTSLYFMTANNIKIGDEIKVSYLPKSTLVLEYGNDISSNNETVKPYKDDNSRIADYIFICVWLITFLVLGIFGKNTYIDEKLEKHIQDDEKKLTDNVVKYHKSYLINGLIFSFLAITIVVIICIITEFYVALCIPIVFGIYCIMSICMMYRNSIIVYNETEMIIYNHFGKKTVVNNCDILSVENNLRSYWLTRGKKIKILQVFYKTNSVANENMHTETLTLYYNVQIGLTRLYTFYTR